MKLQQLSVFLENKPGSLSRPCRLLAEAGINIMTMSLADTQQFGILRLVIRDWERAKTVLEAGGCLVRVTDLVAVEVEDIPGGLAKSLETIERLNLNIEYVYPLTFRWEDRVLLLFRFENPDAAIVQLEKNGLRILKEWKAGQ